MPQRARERRHFSLASAGATLRDAADEVPRLMFTPDAARAMRGSFELLEPLGRGGMGTVWLARDLRHERDVALKVLRNELARGLVVEPLDAPESAAEHGYSFSLYPVGDAPEEGAGVAGWSLMVPGPGGRRPDLDQLEGERAGG